MRKKEITVKISALTREILKEEVKRRGEGHSMKGIIDDFAWKLKRDMELSKQF